MSKQIFCGPGLYLPQEKPKPILPPFGPDKKFTESSRGIFVFGSNLAGAHGGGAAFAAKKKYGAVDGCGFGLQSSYGVNSTLSYALPTKDHRLKSLTVTEIAYWVDALYDDVESMGYQYTWFVTKIGCGLAGFTEQMIAPLFRRFDVRSNVILPTGWERGA